MSQKLLTNLRNPVGTELAIKSGHARCLQSSERSLYRTNPSAYDSTVYKPSQSPIDDVKSFTLRPCQLV